MFNQKELDYIEFGKLTMLKGMLDLQEEGEDLNLINFQFLIDKTMRNIQDPILIESINESINNDTQDNNFEWRETGK